MQSESQIKERRLLLTQVISGMLFSFFLAVHLFNQMSAAWGPEVYDGAQRTLRRGYQAPVIEIILVLGPMLVHAIAGILRMLHQKKQGRSGPKELRARLHRISGIVLLVFFLGHTTATRGASVFFDIFPGFEGIAFTFRWVPLYFWPYYTAFALAGLYHMLYGWSIALPVLGISRASVLRRPRLLWGLFFVGGLLLILGLLHLGGVLMDVGCPEAGPYASMLAELGLYEPSMERCRP
jgi:succinate dehydrogenase/fumarate reductase cytochrome b subunit